ncbi:unnamed protein product [Allacma fusca]|uniref:Tektin n=1 Tax=Allacma fusca TaxID=39272 RepID=A0A8J2L5R1_9HEXA|nr:unnamed protein product [Allacma fusca]
MPPSGGQHDCSQVDVSELNYIKPNVSKFGLLRHSMDEMRCLTLSKENAAADTFANAECVRYEGKRVSQEVNEKTVALQRISTERLKRRSKDVYYFWKELERMILDMREETRLLQELRTRVENAIRATADLILHIVNECLRRRLSRIGIDLTRDDVEEELQKERDMVVMAQQRLQEFGEQVLDQIGKIRAAKERLERDWSDKLQAFRIDDCASRLRPGNPTMINYPGVARFQEGMATACEWETLTRRNMEEAERERCASCKLREILPELLQSLACKLRAQADNVEAAMSRRISETESQKSRLEHQLKLVLEEMVRAEQGIEDIKRALRGDPVESALKLAQTRLYNRTYRPNTELVRDCPQYALIEEVHEIARSQSAMEAQLRNAEDALHKLRQIRIELEKEIAVKDNTLVICRERCQYIRAFWPSVVTLVGH